SKLAFAVGALIAHQALWYAAPAQAQAQAEGAGETYEECVERVQSVKQRRRAGRSVGTRLADVECAPLRDVQVVEEGGAAPVEGAPAQRTRIAPGAAYGMPEEAIAARRAPRPVSPVPRVDLSDYQDPVAIPDRWRIVESIGYTESIWDPYN